MLHLIPAPLHRAAYRLAHALRKIWWRLARPRIHGASLIATDAKGQLLLLRHSYGSGAWSLPTGGINRGEPPEAAARRELREETGCEADVLQFIGVQEVSLHGSRNSVHVYAAEVAGQPKADNREIVEAGFFPLDALPHPLGRLTLQRLAMWPRFSQQG